MKKTVKKPTKAEIERAAKQVRNELVEIEEVEAYECPDCGAVHEYEDDAQECCPRVVDNVTAYKCPECDQLHTDEGLARECCGVRSE